MTVLIIFTQNVYSKQNGRSTLHTCKVGQLSLCGFTRRNIKKIQCKTHTQNKLNLKSRPE